MGETLPPANRQANLPKVPPIILFLLPLLPPVLWVEPGAVPLRVARPPTNNKQPVTSQSATHRSATQSLRIPTIGGGTAPGPPRGEVATVAGGREGEAPWANFVEDPPGGVFPSPLVRFLAFRLHAISRQRFYVHTSGCFSCFCTTFSGGSRRFLMLPSDGHAQEAHQHGNLDARSSQGICGMCARRLRHGTGPIPIQRNSTDRVRKSPHACFKRVSRYQR